MKHLLLLFIFLVSLMPGYGQGNKFKAVNRIVLDSTVVNPFTKDAILIDGSKSPQLRSNSPINAGQLPQLLDSISGDSLPKISLKPAEPKPVFIERQRSQLRSAQMMSNEEITHAFFRETPSLHISCPEKQIRIDKIDADKLGMSHIKGIQLFRNIPVYGMEFTFHVSAQTERFMGYTADSTQIDTLSARLTAEEAIGIAEKDLSQTTKIKSPSIWMKQMMKYKGPTAESIYYPDRFNTFRISYKVIIRPNHRDEWIYYVDAKSGEILKKFNNTPTAGPTKGTGMDLNGVQRSVDTYEENGVHYMVNTTKSMFNAQNFSGTINLFDHEHNLNSQLPTVSSTSTSWNNPKAISLMYNASLVYDYLKQTFGRNSFDDKGSTMFCVINIPDPDTGSPNFDNAYWNGKAIWMGDGDVAFKPIAGALDVTAHEFGHAVVEYTANLEYQYQSGAINESYADIFGAMVDRTNWTIGETIVKNRNYFPTGIMRDMSNPHNGGSSINDNCWQPAHVSEMYFGEQDNGGVHINSSIGNHAFYLYATATSKEKAEQIFYHALCNYLTKTSKFIDLRIAVVQAAKDLYGDADAKLLGESFDRVGVTEDTVSGKPGDLPANPGQQGLLLANLNSLDLYGLYKTTDYVNFTPLTYSKINSKPSVTDDGKLVVFIDANKIYSQGNRMRINQSKIES